MSHPRPGDHHSPLSPNDNKMARKKDKRSQHRQHLRRPTAEDIHTLISRLAAAAKLSARFLSDNDHLLRPSQTLTLDSSLSSFALSLSSIHDSLLFYSPSPTIQNPKPKPDIPTKATHHWFFKFLRSTSNSDPRWLETFRMSKPSFLLLLQTLTPSLLSNDPSFPPDQKLAAALFRLAHAASFRFIARQFGLDGAGHACRAFYEVCKAVIDRLWHLFELESDVERVLQGFGWMSFSGCRGAVDFKRFFIEAKDNVIDNHDSIVVQAVVDSEGRFLDISAGWSGLMCPSEILPRSKLFECNVVSGSNGSMPTYFLGGSCCPLLPWLLTPFDEMNSPNSRAFNDAHFRVMEVVYEAFRELSGRWRLLQVRWNKESIEALPFVIVASCLLHNFLFKCSEQLPADIEEKVMEKKFAPFEGEGDECGEKVRQAVASQIRTRIGHMG